MPSLSLVDPVAWAHAPALTGGFRRTCAPHVRPPAESFSGVLIPGPPIPGEVIISGVFIPGVAAETEKASRFWLTFRHDEIVPEPLQFVVN